MNSKIPYRYRTLLFAVLMSCTTALIVSGLILSLHGSAGNHFLRTWLMAFATAWPIVCVAILVIAPQVNRLLNLVVESEHHH